MKFLPWGAKCFKICAVWAPPQNLLGEPPVLLQITVITITFCSDDLRKSKLMALEKPGKLGELFLPFCHHPARSPLMEF